MRTASIATRQLTEDSAKARPATPAARSRSPLTLRRLRLASGLILFAYVLTHLSNHALGNISLDAMEDGLSLASALWLRMPLGK
jgi:adenylate cyclase